MQMISVAYYLLDINSRVATSCPKWIEDSAQS
jgi:hypothetical protein